jgi:lipoprotein-anchoring transpeptidase ErfK/SrfK
MTDLLHLAVRLGRCGHAPHRPSGLRTRGALGTRALLAATASMILAVAPLGAQRPAQPGDQRIAARVDTTIAALAQSIEQSVHSLAPVRVFHDAADSLDYENARAAAERATEYRIVVSLFDRQLYVLDGPDTLLVAPVAVAVDTTLSYEGRSWTFETPRGRRRVLGKTANPYWTPPEWHYAEVAARQGLKLAHLKAGQTVKLSDGRKLAIRDGRVGTLDATGFWPLPVDDEIIFDGTVFVPPQGTANRRIEGELGKYKLDMGEGFLLHGTPHTDSIGSAATHGCVRLLDQDIEWLYNEVPVGTPVYIY